MNCLECKGACCEQLIVPAPKDRAAMDFFRARGTAVRGPKRDWVRVILECRCPKLGEDGLCTIYEDRPLICAEYRAGGPACIAAARSRRTPEEYERIEAT
jgi:Fe-S-cluster containining protein